MDEFIDFPVSSVDDFRRLKRRFDAHLKTLAPLIEEGGCNHAGGGV